MAYEKKPLRGFLFRNNERKSDSSPTSKGYLVLNKEICQKMIERNDFEFKISAWVDEGKGHHSISVDMWKFNQPPKNDSTNTTSVPEFEGLPT